MADDTQKGPEIESGPFSRLIEPAQIRDAREIRYRASEEECAEIAALLGVISVEQLEALVTLRPWRKHGLGVTGELRAKVSQNCTLTAEPMTSDVAETIDERLYPASRNNKPRPEAIIDIEATDDFEEFEGDAVDIGALLVEYLAMGINPYARKDGVQPAVPIAQEGELPQDDKAPSPFAVLAGRFGRDETSNS